MASDVERKAVFEDEKQIPTVLKWLNEQRKVSRFCDVILRVCGEQIFAHSNVLAAASPYFGSFLGQGQDLPRAFSQKTPQIIEIHIDGSEGDGGYGDAVCRVVNFMYTSSIELSYSILTQVMEISKIMQMDAIIEYCDRFQKGEDGNITMATHSASRKKDLNCVSVSTQTISNLNSSDVNDKSTSDSKTISNLDKINSSRKMIHTPVQKRKRGRPRKLPPSETNAEEKPQAENQMEADSVGIVNDTVDEIDDGEIDEDTESKKQRDENMDDSDEENISSYSYNWVVERTGSGRQVKVPSKYRYSTYRKSVTTSRTEHIPKKTPGEIYTCPDCPYTSDKLFHFRRHRQAHNDDSKKYSCNECEFSSPKLRQLNNHKREHLHAANRCSYCDFKAESEDSLQEHLSKHTGPYPFFCNFCDNKFKSKYQLALHLPKHSEDKPYVCDVCGNGFKWKHALKNHMITHSDTKEHLCDICGFSTAHRSQLKAHHLIHSGETFKCTVLGCNFQATKRQNLKYHMLTHTHEKPHQCEVCGQSFSLVKNMKRHMLLHTNVRPFQCQRCRFSTTRFDKLKEHLLKQHGEGEVPQRRHRLSDYYGSTVPPDPQGFLITKVREDIAQEEAEKYITARLEEGSAESDSQRFITAKLEDGTAIQVQVDNLDVQKGDSATGTQVFTIQQPNSESFPLTLARLDNVNCNDEINLAVQQAVHYVTQCD